MANEPSSASFMGLFDQPPHRTQVPTQPQLSAQEREAISVAATTLISELQGEVRDLTSDLSSAKQEIHELKQNQVSNRDQIFTLTQDLEQRTDGYGQLAVTCTEYEALAAHLKGDVSKLEAECKRLHNLTDLQATGYLEAARNMDATLDTWKRKHIDRCRELQQQVDTLKTEKAKLASDFRKTDIKHAKERVELKRHIGNLQDSDIRRSIRDLKHENRGLREQLTWASDECENQRGWHARARKSNDTLHEAIEGHVEHINKLKDELNHSNYSLRDVQADYKLLMRKKNVIVDSNLALANQYVNIIQSQQAAHTKHCDQLRTLLDGDNLSAALKQTQLALANTQAELVSCKNALTTAQHQCLAARILGGNKVRKQQRIHDQEKRQLYKRAHDTESRRLAVEAQLSDVRSHAAHLHRLVEAQKNANVKLSTTNVKLSTDLREEQTLKAELLGQLRKLSAPNTRSSKKRKRRDKSSSHTGDCGEGSMHQQSGATTRSRARATDNTGDSHGKGSMHQQPGAITRARARATDNQRPLTAVEQALALSQANTPDSASQWMVTKRSQSLLEQHLSIADANTPDSASFCDSPSASKFKLSSLLSQTLSTTPHPLGQLDVLSLSTSSLADTQALPKGLLQPTVLRANLPVIPVSLPPSLLAKRPRNMVEGLQMSSVQVTPHIQQHADSLLHTIRTSTPPDAPKPNDWSSVATCCLHMAIATAYSGAASTRAKDDS
jgi:hypothetical protein